MLLSCFYSLIFYLIFILYELTKILLLSETYRRPIEDRQAWSKTHRRPTCLIGDLNMLHWRLTCPMLIFLLNGINTDWVWVNLLLKVKGFDYVWYSWDSWGYRHQVYVLKEKENVIKQWLAGVKLDNLTMTNKPANECSIWAV